MIAGMSDADRALRQYRWIVHSGRTAFDGAPWLRVDVADVTAPNGERFEHARVHIPDAAIAMVVDERDDTVMMLRRHRWVPDREGFELLGGLVDDGESPRDTAYREALEESGWRPRGECEHLISIEPLPGLVRSTMHIYLWRDGAEQIDQPADPHEAGVLSWVPLAHVRHLAQRRQLLGAGTALAISHYLAHR